MAIEPKVTVEQGGSRTPIPDPTVLTTQASEKAVAALKELIEVRIKALEDVSGRLQAQLDTRPAAILAEIGHLQELMEQKFAGVDQQFAGRDTALAAALLAQKTSVEEQNKSNALSASKSEAAFTKQIDGIGTLIVTTTKATDDKIEGVKQLVGTVTKASDEKINDIRERLNGADGRSAGHNDSWAFLVAGIGALAGIGGIVALFLK